MRFFLFLLLLVAKPCMALECSFVEKDPHYSLEKCGNLTVLTLKGSPLERARANGRATKKRLSQEVIQYFSHKVLNVVAPADGIKRTFLSFLLNQASRLLFLGTPSELRAEVAGMADELGVSSVDLERAFLLPDMGAMAFALSSRASAPMKETAMGCTSVVRKYDPNSLIYGRNLDFAGVGTYDKLPQITVHLPKPNTGELKHIAFGAQGMSYAGITGVNEAGIGFAVHQNYTRDRSLLGIPMLFVGELVLRKASSIDEAIAIIDKNRTNPIWTFVLTDFKTGEAATVEESRAHFAVRRMSGISLAQSNHLQNPKLAEQTEIVPIGVKINSAYRLKTALEKLDTFTYPTDYFHDLLSILSSHGDQTGALAAFSDTIKAHTIQTVLLLGTEGKLREASISEGLAPAASGQFLRFQIADLWNESSAPLTYAEIDSATSPFVREKQMQTSAAFAAYFDRKDYDQALQLVQSQLSPNAALFRATLHYLKNQPMEALREVDLALHPITGKLLPSHIYQSGLRLKMLAEWQLFPANPAQAQKTAKLILDSHALNPSLQVLAKKIAAGEKFKERETHLAFDFFSGEIVSP